MSNRITRRLVQGTFLVLVLVGVFVLGANCERWCPFGAIEASYTYASEGNMVCSLGTSNFFIFGGVLLSVLLARRAFCGYACPIGTISDWLYVLGQKIHLTRLRVSPRWDRVLSALKYPALAAILWFTWHESELIFRAFDPCYALISRHGEDISFWAYVISGAIVLSSLFISLPFCRWLCPLAAVLNPFSRFGLLRIRRDTGTCSNCGLCAKNCPTEIPVDQLEQVTAARCLTCMNCVDACPHAKNAALTLKTPGPRGMRWSQAAMIFLLLSCMTGAVWASYLFPIPSFVKSQGNVPEATQQVVLEIEDLGCRGRANLFYYFLTRDDMYQVPGYMRLEAWPGPGVARVRVAYDPAETDEAAIKTAITEPYYDAVADQWRMSPFNIVGYDPFDLD